MAPATVRRYEKSGSFDGTRSIFPLLEAIPAQAWTPTMIEQTQRAAVENSQVQHAVLIPSGQPVPEAVSELLREVMGEPEPPATPPSAADDIPF